MMRVASSMEGIGIQQLVGIRINHIHRMHSVIMRIIRTPMVINRTGPIHRIIHPIRVCIKMTRASTKVPITTIVM